MSAAYIYGGIDRTHVCWALEGQTAAQCADRFDNSVDAGRASSAAYAYGGLDRTPVEWSVQLPPAAGCLDT